LGTAKETSMVSNVMSKARFVVVQDAFMTKTAKQADVILPASFTVESTGSYTNTYRIIQQFNAQLHTKIDMTNLEQLSAISKLYGLEISTDAAEIVDAIASELPSAKDEKHQFVYTVKEGNSALFNNGADALTKQFDDMFKDAFAVSRVKVEEKVYGL